MHLFHKLLFLILLVKYLNEKANTHKGTKANISPIFPNVPCKLQQLPQRACFSCLWQSQAPAAESGGVGQGAVAEGGGAASDRRKASPKLIASGASIALEPAASTKTLMSSPSLSLSESRRKPAEECTRRTSVWPRAARVLRSRRPRSSK